MVLSGSKAKSSWSNTGNPEQYKMRQTWLSNHKIEKLENLMTCRSIPKKSLSQKNHISAQSFMSNGTAAIYWDLTIAISRFTQKH